jgi:hypothetical protein
MSVLTIRELLAIHGDSDVSVNRSISYISTFSFTDKQTRSKKAKSTSTTIITTAWKNRKRVVIGLTEMLI